MLIVGGVIDHLHHMSFIASSYIRIALNVRLCINEVTRCPLPFLLAQASTFKFAIILQPIPCVPIGNLSQLKCNTKEVNYGIRSDLL